jgi:hypothetical protein
VANGRAVATWDLKEGGDVAYTAPIPPRAKPGQTVIIEFRVEHPVSPYQDGMSQDKRQLGFGLAGFRFDEKTTR